MSPSEEPLQTTPPPPPVGEAPKRPARWRELLRPVWIASSVSFVPNPIVVSCLYQMGLFILWAGWLLAGNVVAVVALLLYKRGTAAIGSFLGMIIAIAVLIGWLIITLHGMD